MNRCQDRWYLAPARHPTYERTVHSQRRRLTSSGWKILEGDRKGTLSDLRSFRATFRAVVKRRPLRAPFGVSSRQNFWRFHPATHLLSHPATRPPPPRPLGHTWKNHRWRSVGSHFPPTGHHLTSTSTSPPPPAPHLRGPHARRHLLPGARAIHPRHPREVQRLQGLRHRSDDLQGTDARPTRTGRGEAEGTRG